MCVDTGCLLHLTLTRCDIHQTARILAWHNIHNMLLILKMYYTCLTILASDYFRKLLSKFCQFLESKKHIKELDIFTNYVQGKAGATKLLHVYRPTRRLFVFAWGAVMYTGHVISNFTKGLKVPCSQKCMLWENCVWSSTSFETTGWLTIHDLICEISHIKEVEILNHTNLFSMLSIMCLINENLLN